MAKQSIAHEISVVKAFDIIKFLDPKTSVMVWGQPGIGKTIGLHDVFGEMGYRIVPVLAGCMEPTDISGIPVNIDSQYCRYLAGEWAWECGPDAPKELQGPAILFFDDLLTAHEQTQNAFFRVVWERKVGAIHLRDNVRIIAASNRVDDRSGAIDMGLALGNRFVHLYTRPDSDVWLAWARKSDIHPDIIGFVQRRPEYVSTFEKELENPSTEKAFATPRSWEQLSTSIKNFEIYNNNIIRGEIGKTTKTDSESLATLATLASGIIGAGVAMEYISWLRNTKGLVPPEEIAKNGDEARVPTEIEIDIIHATIASASHYAKNHPTKWKQFLRYSLRVPVSELGLILAKQIVEIIMSELPDEDKADAASSDEFGKMFTRWGKHLQESEI